jgi:LysM repeat protein
MRTQSRLVSVGLGALAMTLALACGQTVAQDPLFQKQSERIDTLQSDVQELNRKLAALSAIDTEFQQVSKDVQALKTTGAAGSMDAVEALGRRLERHEEQLSKLNGAVEAFEKKLADRSKVVAVNSAATAAAAARGAQPQGAQANSPDSKSVAAATAQRAPAGRYHMIRGGDTVDKLAGEYKVSAETIRAANHLPGGSRLLAGQRLYIPVRSIR